MPIKDAIQKRLDDYRVTRSGRRERRKSVLLAEEREEEANRIAYHALFASSHRRRTSHC
jgi:hypothetical protein